MFLLLPPAGELSVLPYFLRDWGALWKEIFDTIRSKKSQLLLQSQLWPFSSLYQAQGLESMQSFTSSFLWWLCGSVVATRTIPTGMWHLLTSSMPSVCPASWWWSTSKAFYTQVATVPEPALVGIASACSVVISKCLVNDWCKCLCPGSRWNIIMWLVPVT